MSNGMSSYRKRNQAKINAKMATMRKAKEAKRLSAEPPEYPLDRSGDYRIILIEDYMAGVKTEHILLLTPVDSGQGRCDQFHVWLDTEYQGIMGWKRTYTLAGQQFIRVGSPQ